MVSSFEVNTSNISIKIMIETKTRFKPGIPGRLEKMCENM